jgi:hypothetical protein
MPCEYVSSVRDLRGCPSWAATCVIEGYRRSRRRGDTRQPDLRTRMERPGAGRGRGETTANRTPERASHFHPLATHKLVAHCEQRVRPGSPGPWKATLKARHFGRRRGRSPARRYSGGEGKHDSQGTEACATGNVADLDRPDGNEPGGKRIHRGQTTMSVEPAGIEELRGRVLGIIGAYGMGDSVDPRKLYLKTAPATPPPPVPVPVGGNISDGVIPNNALDTEPASSTGRPLEARRPA